MAIPLTLGASNPSPSAGGFRAGILRGPGPSLRPDSWGRIWGPNLAASDFYIEARSSHDYDFGGRGFESCRARQAKLRKSGVFDLTRQGALQQIPYIGVMEVTLRSGETFEWEAARPPPRAPSPRGPARTRSGRWTRWCSQRTLR